MPDRELTARARLASALTAVARGLPNVFDESTDYFHGFSASLCADILLTPEAFKTALRVGSAYRIDFTPAADFFAATRACEEPVASGFALLEKLMQASLRDLTVAFARRENNENKEPAVRQRMWLFGRIDGGDLVGLESEVSET